MKHRLSFANFKMLSEHIVEVVVDEGVNMSLEMIEECHQFINEHFSERFAMLINRVNNYTYSYEAKLSVASYENLVAIAFVYYTEDAKKLTDELYKLRAFDGWNYRIFSGMELGWQQALTWLKQELMTEKTS